MLSNGIRKKNKWKRKWDEKQNINCRRCCVDKLHLWKVFAAVNNDNDRYALTAQNIWNKNMVKKHEMILTFFKYIYTHIYIYTSAKRNYLPTYIYSYFTVSFYHLFKSRATSEKWNFIKSSQNATCIWCGRQN